jgi:hypothetical protein
MKVLFCSLIILICLECTGQKKDAWRTIGIYSGSIVFNAMGDGFKDSGRKELGHFCNAVSISFLVISPFLMDYQKDKWWAYPITYGFLRIAYFDWTYNASRGLPYNYIGNSSIWDKYFMQQIKPPDGFAAGRGVAFIIGISVPLNTLRSEKQKKDNEY